MQGMRKGRACRIVLPGVGGTPVAPVIGQWDQLGGTTEISADMPEKDNGYHRLGER